jgi:hypothetical protein
MKMRLGLMATVLGLGLTFAAGPAFVSTSVDQAIAATKKERAAARAATRAKRAECRAQARAQKISLFKRQRFLKSCMSKKG